MSHISCTQKCSKSCALSRLASNLSHSELLITKRSRLETFNDHYLSLNLKTKKIGLFHFDFIGEGHDINPSDLNIIILTHCVFYKCVSETVFLSIFFTKFQTFFMFRLEFNRFSSEIFEIFCITPQHPA